jgi:hypothetical protein
MSQTTNISQLFQDAHDAGDLSLNSLNAFNIVDPGQQIQNALGVNVDDVESSDVVLVTVMVDDSGSMHKNQDVASTGHNEVLTALGTSSQKDNVLVHTRLLNGAIISPFCPLDQANHLDQGNYRCNQGTPLYDQGISCLATVLAKTQEFADNGVPARSVTLIVTDGADVHSKSKPSAVRSVVEDMLKTENHIIAFMGIDDGYTNFRAVAQSMGIRDEWVLTPSNSPKEIRDAFALFSQSAVRASQNQASFSKAAMGGFGN